MHVHTMSIEFQQNQQAQLEIGLTISREKRSRMKEVTKISGEDELSQVDEEFLVCKSYDNTKIIIRRTRKQRWSWSWGWERNSKKEKVNSS